MYQVAAHTREYMSSRRAKKEIASATRNTAVQQSAMRPS